MNKSASKERLTNVFDAIALIQSFIENQSEGDFLLDLKGQNAVMFQFLIIGEAVKNIDISLLEKFNYPWHIPKSFRNFITHEYHNIKLERIYFAAKDLNPLKKCVVEILKTEFI
jgi:uncharacterized protein with HEPN domain